MEPLVFGTIPWCLGNGTLASPEMTLGLWLGWLKQQDFPLAPQPHQIADVSHYVATAGATSNLSLDFGDSPLAYMT